MKILIIHILLFIIPDLHVCSYHTICLNVYQQYVSINKKGSILKFKIFRATLCSSNLMRTFQEAYLNPVAFLFSPRSLAVREFLPFKLNDVKTWETLSRVFTKHPVLQTTVLQNDTLIAIEVRSHMCEGLFLCGLFCSIILCLCLIPVPHCCDYCSFIIHCEIRK